MNKSFRTSLILSLLLLNIGVLSAHKKLIYEVNPFIGTANFGATHPGAVLPHGLMSVSPFNVMGENKANKYDKDARWWSMPYTTDNKYFTGFSHVNLSGVGCPDLASFIIMPTQGSLNVDYHSNGSTISNESAHPGFYSAYIDRYKIKAKVTVTERASIMALHYDSIGQGNIILNLGAGLTNETGAMVRFVNDSTIVGAKIMGTFCYAPQAVFTQYFAMKLSTKPTKKGYWKKQEDKKGPEAQWDPDNGQYKLYRDYQKEMMGDNIGVYFSFPVGNQKDIYIQTAVSFVSQENALLNLEKEQPSTDFEKTLDEAENTWEKALSVIEIEGGTQNDRTIFYTALYHLLLHPNILQDINGEYPAMGSLKTLKTSHNRYTVYSLWDTYRNVHPLLSLLYPSIQLDMVRSMIDMYKESGWLPKWELFSAETYTMEGDPALVVINDTYQRGLKDFDINAAWSAMWHSANAPGKENKMRPDNDDYLRYNYVPLREQFDNSVSHALEYYIADWNLAQFAKSLGKEKEYKTLIKRVYGYRKYYDFDSKCLRPLDDKGHFITPFDPEQGKNFEPSPGFHEGTAWNYSFFIPYDIKGLINIMGGNNAFTNNLLQVFKSGNYDPSNEPDIAYPYLFSYIKGKEYHTQELVNDIIKKYYHNAPEGIPGNDDTGTMSAWLIYSMLGFYPDCPGDMSYSLTTPFFDKATIHLDKRYFNNDTLTIYKKPAEGHKNGIYFNSIQIGNRTFTNKYRIQHSQLIDAKEITFLSKDQR